MISPITREICAKAADLLEGGYWTQGKNKVEGTEQDPRPKYCAIGALGAAATDKGGVYTVARESVERFLGIQRGSLVTWNDDKTRSEIDVVTVLRAVAHQ